MPAQRVSEIEWSSWVPELRAAEVLVVQSQSVLLIRKKRGLGAGKINGPGGRLEAGETVEACAIREVQEELRVTPLCVEWSGEHRIQFLDGLSIHLDVFRADAVQGTPTETDEALPLWFPLDRIPYEEMWADTRVWLPWLLARKRFSGRFVFDGDRMLDHVLEASSRTGPRPNST